MTSWLTYSLATISKLPGKIVITTWQNLETSWQVYHKIHNNSYKNIKTNHIYQKYIISQGIVIVANVDLCFWTKILYEIFQLLVCECFNVYTFVLH